MEESISGNVHGKCFEDFHGEKNSLDAVQIGLVTESMQTMEKR